MQSTTVLTRGTCGAMVRLMDALYKWGVADASRLDDAAVCEDFIARTKEPGVFGKVVDGYVMDSREWQLTLSFMARKRSMHGTMYRYLEDMGGYGRNCLSVLLPVAQDFYNMGLTDYNANPGLSSLDVFMDTPKVRWVQGMPKIDTNEFIEQIQLMCYSRKHADETYEGKKLNSSFYDIFVKLMSTGIRVQQKWFEDV